MRAIDFCAGDFLREPSTGYAPYFKAVLIIAKRFFVEAFGWMVFDEPTIWPPPGASLLGISWSPLRGSTDALFCRRQLSSL